MNAVGTCLRVGWQNKLIHLLQINIHGAGLFGHLTALNPPYWKRSIIRSNYSKIKSFNDIGDGYYYLG